MAQVILYNVTNGLIIGAFFVLMALGLSLILNLSNVINFAHGNFLALGGYFAYQLTVGLSIPAFTFPGANVGLLTIPSFSFAGVTLLPGISYWAALLIAPLLTALVGVAIERSMIRRIYDRDPVYSLLFTFGLAFVMQDAARFSWGPNGLPMGLPATLARPISSSLFFITWYRVFMVAVVIIAVVGLFTFLRRSRVGLRIRAGTLDLETVSVLGINVRNLRTFNFGVGCLLAGLSGVLAAGQIGLNPNMGDDLLLPSFIAIIVGGVGSLIGTLFGGLLIGVAAALTTVFYPSASEAVIYAIMMAVLLIRPRGLMGEEGMMS
jgi:branched-chain amino acid transport system permease protein